MSKNEKQNEVVIPVDSGNEGVINQVNNQKVEGVETPKYATMEEVTTMFRELLNSVMQKPAEPRQEVKDEPKEKTYEDYTNW